jgi:hypothetical protein
MPIPKAFVVRREEMNVAREDCQGETSPPAACRHAFVSSEEQGATRAVKPAPIIKNQQPSHAAAARKKRGAVKWKDLPNDAPHEVEASAQDNHVGFVKKGTDDDHDEDGDALQQPATCRSPSPSSSLTLMELEQHILKQESSIRRACELELKLLNQCTRVREKRSLMVQRLRKMKRKLQKLANEDKWTAGKYSFPPEYYEHKPSSSRTLPLMIDMTETGSVDDAAAGAS